MTQNTQICLRSPNPFCLRPIWSVCLCVVSARWPDEPYRFRTSSAVTLKILIRYSLSTIFFFALSLFCPIYISFRRSFLGYLGYLVSYVERHSINLFSDISTRLLVCFVCFCLWHQQTPLFLDKSPHVPFQLTGTHSLCLNFWVGRRVAKTEFI